MGYTEFYQSAAWCLNHSHMFTICLLPLSHFEGFGWQILWQGVTGFGGCGCRPPGGYPLSGPSIRSHSHILMYVAGPVNIDSYVLWSMVFQRERGRFIIVDRSGFFNKRVLKPNSWKYNFVEVSGHGLESSQTWGFRIQCLHYILVWNNFCSGGGGGEYEKLNQTLCSHTRPKLGPLD